jgi:glucose-6-phosphate isomerase
MERTMNTIQFSIPENIQKAVEERLLQWQHSNTAKGIWHKEASVWKEKPEEQVEISNRLGWLSLPEMELCNINKIMTFATEVKDSFTKVLLLGMGGSSLAPEVFAKTFGHKEGYPSLAIVDSTHPAVIKKILDTYDLQKTLFVVASKSGGTAETSSFFYTFYEALAKLTSHPGKNFVALTDPGSNFEKIAKEKKFLKIFSTPPEVGGRYSVLTEFGMVPAALMGINIAKFLDEAKKLQTQCKPGIKAEENPGLHLGAVLGELAKTGRDKITFYVSPEIASFPQWVEQLVAESTGKEGKGILPVADENFEGLEYYGDDRVLVFFKVRGGKNASIENIEHGARLDNIPVISIELHDVYSLAQEFYRWEFATASASIILGINPFDQPNVQLAKTLANESLKAYKETGSLPVETPVVTDGNIEVLTPAQGGNVKSVVDNFLTQAKNGDYLGICAFVEYGKEIDEALTELRQAILKRYKIAVTLGYGPRFLHSTGQLHKGDGNNGLFIQIVNDIQDDVEVVGQGYSFGTLITAQAQGDAKALLSKKRRLLKLRIKGDLAIGIKALI